jgi:hypothetical protein
MKERGRGGGDDGGQYTQLISNLRCSHSSRLPSYRDSRAIATPSDLSNLSRAFSAPHVATAAGLAYSAMPRDALHLPNTDTRTAPLTCLVQPIRAQALAGWRWHAKLPARGRLQSGKMDRARDGERPWTCPVERGAFPEINCIV